MLLRELCDDMVGVHQPMVLLLERVYNRVMVNE